MKTDELIGPALDWAVAKCEGIDLFETEGWVYSDGTRAVFRPSTDWRQGGFIIEREKILLDVFDDGTWVADGHEKGPTPLIAAMRAYVANKMGEEIEVPDVLL